MAPSGWLHSPRSPTQALGGLDLHLDATGVLDRSKINFHITQTSCKTKNIYHNKIDIILNSSNEANATDKYI